MPQPHPAVLAALQEQAQSLWGVCLLPLPCHSCLGRAGWEARAATKLGMVWSVVFASCILFIWHMAANSTLIALASLLEQCYSLLALSNCVTQSDGIAWKCYAKALSIFSKEITDSSKYKILSGWLVARAGLQQLQCFLEDFKTRLKELFQHGYRLCLQKIHGMCLAKFSAGL